MADKISYLDIVERMHSDIDYIVGEAYQKGYDHCEEKAKKICKKAYQGGLDDAWEAARKVVLNPEDSGMSLTDLFVMFGHRSIQSVLKNYSASEAIAKLKAYEEKQKNNNEIKVGDEVESLYDDRTTVVENTIPWVVTKIREGYNGKKYYYGIDAEGALRNNDFIRKTGRHFDIDKILEKMKE